MASLINEHTQYEDIDGKPINNGKLYVGTSGLNPKLNPITIYSDRSLTTVISNPQLLDSSGRTANKIWVSGPYSLQVDNTNDVQKYIDLDAGSVSETGVTILTDIQGENTITATASIASYVDGQIYVIQPENNNTGATTLNIGGLGAKNIVVAGSSLLGGELRAGINYTLIYNADNDNFDLSVYAIASRWDSGRTYKENESAVGDDGVLYYSQAASNLNNNPLTDAANWKTTVSNDLSGVSASVSGSAMTVGILPDTIDFRSSSLTNGSPVTRRFSSALSLVIPSGATLGSTDGNKSTITILAIDVSGTVELAVTNLAGGVNIDETGVISTTAIDAASDSADVVYSTSARTNVAYRVCGVVESTQAAAGAWATAPSLVQGAGGNALTSMGSIGYGQTEQDVSGSRVRLTTYYNTSNKPFTLYITVDAQVSGQGFFINGTIKAEWDSSAAELNHGTFIIRPGSSYSTDATFIVDWWESR